MRRSVFCQYVICLLLLSFTVMANAQKLPNIQTKGQWLPATAKVDGQLSEWGNVLKAFNKATGVEYTIANDDKNLYLAVRSKDISTSIKIVMGGITFIVGPSKAMVAFPIAKPAYDTSKGYVTITYLSTVVGMLQDSLAVQEEIVKSKDIKVFKLKGVKDSILSIYNPYSIKSKMSYNNAVLIYELSIPLELINSGSQRLSALEYSIRLNGVKVPPEDHNAPGPPMAPPGSPYGKAMAMSESMENATDFSEKYTLGKK